MHSLDIDDKYRGRNLYRWCRRLQPCTVAGHQADEQWSDQENLNITCATIVFLVGRLTANPDGACIDDEQAFVVEIIDDPFDHHELRRFEAPAPSALTLIGRPLLSLMQMVAMPLRSMSPSSQQ